MTTTLAYRWACIDCDATGDGPGSDLAARKHEAAEHHSTITFARPEEGK